MSSGDDGNEQSDTEDSLSNNTATRGGGAFSYCSMGRQAFAELEEMDKQRKPWKMNKADQRALKKQIMMESATKRSKVVDHPAAAAKKTKPAEDSAEMWSGKAYEQPESSSSSDYDDQVQDQYRKAACDAENELFFESIANVALTCYNEDSTHQKPNINSSRTARACKDPKELTVLLKGCQGLKKVKIVPNLLMTVNSLLKLLTRQLNIKKSENVVIVRDENIMSPDLLLSDLKLQNLDIFEYSIVVLNVAPAESNSKQKVDEDSEKRQPARENCIYLRFNLAGILENVEIEVNRDESFSEITKRLCEEQNVDVSIRGKLQPVFDGELIEPQDTPSTAGVFDGAVVDLIK